MKLKLIVWHLNRDLAIARGLGSNEAHMRPLVGAICMHTEKDEADAKQLWKARCYEPVAIATYTPDPHRSSHHEKALEYAFEKTNHITTPWNVPPVKKRVDDDYAVEPLHYERNRSTSVGDFIEVIDNAVTLLYVCAPIGWKRIDF